MQEHMRGFRYIIIVLFLCIGTIIVLSKVSAEGKDEYFEGKIINKTEEYLIVQPDAEYEELREILGNEIKIEKKDVLGDCDFSRFNINDEIRILYSELNKSQKEIKQYLSIHLISDLTDE